MGESASRRLAAIVSAFILFVLIGVVALRLFGGSDGNYAHDIYKVLTLFPLNGSWVIQEHIDNPVILVQAFIAPVFAVYGLIELFARDLARNVVRAVKLSQLSGHLVLIGLSEESLMLLDALREDDPDLRSVIIDKNLDTTFAQRARKSGAIIVPGDPGAPETLTRARLSKANQAIFLHAGVTDALQFILAANTTISGAAPSRKSEPAEIELWVGLTEASIGARLGEYFKFTGLSENLHTRFFSLDELAARQLLRAHPPDIYADAFGHKRIHIAVYGLNSLGIQVITETLRQCVTLCTERVKFTILAEEDENDVDLLRAAHPAIDEIADIEYRKIVFYPTGLADFDYQKIPEDATLHVVCCAQAEKAASVALSLRRLLLVRPQKARHVSRRLNAPILVRLARTRGIGELLRSNIDRMRLDGAFALDASVAEREMPDGLFAFGTLEDLLSADKGRLFIPTLIDPRREAVAKRIHALYIEQRTLTRRPGADAAAIQRRSEQSWAALAPEFRDSCRQSADHLFAKARVLRMRITKAADELSAPSERPMNVSPEDVQKLALVEHHRWMNERFLAGWTFDEKRVDAARRHNLLRPWSEIPDAETRVDYRIVDQMRQALKAAGLDARPSFMIGVVGHRSGAHRPFDADRVRAALRARLLKEINARPDREAVMLTSLAPGTDIIGAEIALELGVPYIVPLPLPFEALIQDFSDEGREELDRFLRLVAKSERYIEMPLRFGDLADVSRSEGDDPVARRQQYALAGAYIAERADLLLAVWDGERSRGLGGTADIVAWRARGGPPPEYCTAGNYYAQPEISPAEIIAPA